MTTPELDRRLARARAAIVTLSTALFAVGVLAWVGWSRSGARGSAGDDLIQLSDADVQRDVVRGLVAESAGIWDSFADPDVGRVLQPGLVDRPNGSFRVSSNARGVREEEWAVPKPAGRVRVVVLGDSFVFGNGIQPEDRLARFLEEALVERGRVAGVECLSLGMAAWNLHAECAFLRRQLSDLDPDLVVHVSVSNDLDDNPGVRGFGAMARFTTAARERADGFVTTSYPFTLGHKVESWLEAGLDWESRMRYRQAADEMLALAELVEARGGHYLAVFFWPGALPIVARRIGAELGPERCAFIPSSFRGESEYRLSATDKHWNRAGNELVARLVYGLVHERGWLPRLELAAWDAATAAVARLHDAGLRESEAPAEESDLLQGRVATERIDFTSLDAVAAAQVHGGVDRSGLVAPYASLLLANRDARVLRFVGACLDRPELAGTVRVHLDDVEVLAFDQTPGQRINERVPIPDALRARTHLSLRLTLDDWAYAGESWGDCVGFRLVRASLEP